MMRIELGDLEYWVGNVRFAEPVSYTAALKPFVRVADEEGNKYHVGGLVGLLRAVKEKRPKAVLCLKEDEAYRIVRWF